LFIVAVCLGIFMRRGANKQTVVLLAAFLTIPIIIVAGQELFRILYYGDWVPNTARVKVAFSSVHLLFGIYYLKSGIYRNFPLFLFVLTALILSYQKKIKREDIELYLFPFVLWCLYLVLLGGDNFYFHRQFIPLIVLSAFVLSYLFVQLLSSKKIMIGKRIITGGVVILLIVQEFLQITDPDKRLVLKDIQWVNISKTIGLTLGQTFYQQRPSIAIDAAGGIPYWSQLPSLDMLGLNDSYIPRHPPADYDSKLIGHGMGNGEYVFNKKPDIVCFNSIGGFKTILPGGMQMFSNPLFYQNYVPLKLQFYNPSSLRVLLWINKQSEKIGLQTKTDSLCIPGWLMNQDSIQIHSYPLTDDTLPIAAWFGEGNGTAPGASAQLDENNRLATFFTAATPARMNNIVLAPGTWRVAMEPLDTNEQFIIYPYLGTSTVLQNMDTQFTLSDSTLVNIVIAPKDSAVHKIRVLRFLRCND
jgi:arabinofuranosyltransferase